MDYALCTWGVGLRGITGEENLDRRQKKKKKKTPARSRLRRREKGLAARLGPRGPPGTRTHPLSAVNKSHLTLGEALGARPLDSGGRRRGLSPRWQQAAGISWLLARRRASPRRRLLSFISFSVVWVGFTRTFNSHVHVWPPTRSHGIGPFWPAPTTFMHLSAGRRSEKVNLVTIFG